MIPIQKYSPNTIPIKIPACFFAEIAKLILKYTQKFKGPRPTKIILKQKSCKTHTSQPQDLLQAAVIKTVWYWHKNIQINGIKQSPEINSHIYSQLIFNKGAKTIQWRKNSLFNKWFWDKCISTFKRMTLEFYPISYTKTNSKWIKDLKVRGKTTNPLKESICINLHDYGLDSGFLAMTPKAQAIKEQENVASSKLNCCALNDTIKKVKNRPQKSKSICKSYLISNLYPDYIKNS